MDVASYTKLIRTIGGGFRREKIYIVTWLSGLPKSLRSDLSTRSSIS